MWETIFPTHIKQQQNLVFYTLIFIFFTANWKKLLDQMEANILTI